MPPTRPKRAPKPPPRQAARRREIPRQPRPIPIASSEVELLEDEVMSLPRTRAPNEASRAMATEVHGLPSPQQETNILSLSPPVPTPHATPVTATLTPVLQPAFLYIDQGPGAGRAIPLHEGELVIGRSSSAGLQLNHPSVSRQHLVVRRSGDQFFVRDCGSHNGSFLNGRTIRGEQELFSGDELTLGRVVLVMRSTAPMVTGRTVIPAPIERTGVKLAIFGGAALLGVALVLVFARARPVQPANIAQPELATSPVIAATPIAEQRPAPGAKKREQPVEAKQELAAPAPGVPSEPETIGSGEISATKMLEESRKAEATANVKEKRKSSRATTRKTARSAGYDRAALAVYLAGDLDSAVAAASQAGDEALRRKLKQLEAAIASARADANFGDTTGAKRHYGRALAIDKQLAGGKGKLNRELRRELEGLNLRATRTNAARSAADAAFGD